MKRHKLAFAAALGSSLIATATSFADKDDKEPLKHDRKMYARVPEPLRGVQLSLEPTSGGVAVRFTTVNKGELEDLRSLLREAATLIEYHTKLAALHPEERQSMPDEIPAIPGRRKNIDVKDIKGARRSPFGRKTLRSSAAYAHRHASSKKRGTRARA